MREELVVKELVEIINILERENDGRVSGIKSLRADRVLNNEELMLAIYYDLFKWFGKDKTDEGETFKFRLIKTIENINQKALDSTAVEGVSLGTVVRDYIRMKTGDWEFGKNDSWRLVKERYWKVQLKELSK